MFYATYDQEEEIYLVCSYCGHKSILLKGDKSPYSYEGDELECRSCENIGVIGEVIDIEE